MDSPNFHAVPSWYISTDAPDEIFERVSLNDVFVDNGVYLEYTDPVSNSTVDVTAHIQRYGYVNTQKVGEYVLRYMCTRLLDGYVGEWAVDRTDAPFKEGATVVSRDGSYYLLISMPTDSAWALSNDPLTNDDGIWQKLDVESAVSEWELIRKVIVYEPNWLIDTTPQISQTYPLFRQTIQRYSDIYYELSYQARDARWGLKSSPVSCEKYMRSWSKPEGEIFKLDSEKRWHVCGYTFCEGDSVEVCADNDGLFDDGNFIVYKVWPNASTDQWTPHHKTDVRSPNARYKKGDWVHFCGKIYVCYKSHNIIQDTFSKINPQIIYPTNANYWSVGCVIDLIEYKYSGGKRSINFDVMGEHSGKLGTRDDSGNIITFKIRRRRPLVDSQGFIFKYDYGLVKPPPVTDKYIVTVNNGTGSGEYAAGTLVAIKADIPASGYRFAGWELVSGGVTIADTSASTTTFVMPNNDVEVSAIMESVPIEAPIINSFAVSPSEILHTASATLSWDVEGADAVTITSDKGESWTVSDRPISTETVQYPNWVGTVTYTITATNDSGTVTQTTALTVSELPIIISDFNVVPTSILHSGLATVHWAVSNATTVTVVSDKGDTWSTTSGSEQVSYPDFVGTVTFTLTASNLTDTVTQTITLAVDEPDIVISTFVVTPNVIGHDGNAVLSWDVENANSIVITSSQGETWDVSNRPVGTETVQYLDFDGHVTYTITATAIVKSATDSTTLYINEPVPMPSAVISAAPNPVVAGEVVRISWITEDAESVSITGIGTNLEKNGYRDITLSDETTFTITAANATGTATDSVTVSTVVRVLPEITRWEPEWEYIYPDDTEFKIFYATLLADEIKVYDEEDNLLLSSFDTASGAFTWTGTVPTGAEEMVFKIEAVNDDGEVYENVTVPIGEVITLQGFIIGSPSPFDTPFTCDEVLVRWQTVAVDELYIQDIEVSEMAGEMYVNVCEDQNLVLHGYRNNGRQRGTLVSFLQVNHVPPIIREFSWNTTTNTLTWDVYGGIVTITGLGEVENTDSRVIPNPNLAYYLVAVGLYGTSTASVFIRYREVEGLVAPGELEWDVTFGPRRPEPIMLNIYEDESAVAPGELEWDVTFGPRRPEPIELRLPVESEVLEVAGQLTWSLTFGPRRPEHIELRLPVENEYITLHEAPTWSLTFGPRR